MSTTWIIVIILVLSPLIYFIGGFIFKILWGFGPLIISTAVGGYLVWQNGFNWIAAVPAGLMLGIVFAWFWQRTRIFLRVDRWIENHVFFDR